MVIRSENVTLRIEDMFPTIVPFDTICDEMKIAGVDIFKAHVDVHQQPESDQQVEWWIFRVLEPVLFLNRTFTLINYNVKINDIKVDREVVFSHDGESYAPISVHWKERIPLASFGQAIAVMGLHGNAKQKGEVENFLLNWSNNGPDDLYVKSPPKHTKVPPELPANDFLQLVATEMFAYTAEQRAKLKINFYWDHSNGGIHFTLSEAT